MAIPGSSSKMPSVIRSPFTGLTRRPSMSASGAISVTVANSWARFSDSGTAAQPYPNQGSGPSTLITGCPSPARDVHEFAGLRIEDVLALRARFHAQRPGGHIDHRLVLAMVMPARDCPGV